MRKKKLKFKTVVKFQINDPFSFEKTFFKPSHFASKLELFNKNCYYTTLTLKKKTFGLKYLMQRKKLILEVYSERKIDSKTLQKIEVEIRFRLSLDVDYSQFYNQYANDKFIGDVIKMNLGKRISNIYSLYEHLIVSTFLQNANVKRTISMCQNMLEKYGTPVIFDNVELYAIWRPENLIASEEELRTLKIGYRAKIIMRLTEQFRDRHVSETELRKLLTDSLKKELLKIYGVGKQTVFYTISEQFHRTEYLRHIPPWELKILSRYVFDKDLCDEKQLIDWFHKQYGKWCGFALSMIFEDIFHKHKKKSFPWLQKIMKEK